MHLIMMFPDDLPRTRAELGGRVSEQVASVVDGVDRCADVPEILRRLGCVALRPDGVKLATWATRDDGRRGVQYTILDRFFGIIRADEGSSEMFGHSALLAYRGFLEDTVAGGSDLGTEAWNEIRTSLEYLLGISCGRSISSDVRSVPAGRADRDPHRRWRTGHQIFFPLIQAIILGLNEFHDAVLDDQKIAATDALGFVGRMMSASARAMEFAADFPPEDYARAVRPSMTPPGVAQSLSGLMSADHHLMVNRFQEMRPLAHGLDERQSVAFREFRDTVAETYAAHVQVCDRFNGSHMVSLRMHRSQPLTATEVVEQLGRSRLKMLGAHHE